MLFLGVCIRGVMIHKFHSLVLGSWFGTFSVQQGKQKNVENNCHCHLF